MCTQGRMQLIFHTCLKLLGLYCSSSAQVPNQPRKISAAYNDYSSVQRSLLIEKLSVKLQTWDLTRLMYYGFTEFCQCFLQRFPGYYIWPLRLNGSALETIFSQLKFSMNGQLSSVNYAPALATLKLKRRIHGQRGKFVYRKTPLYVRELPLKRCKHKC